MLNRWLPALEQAFDSQTSTLTFENIIDDENSKIVKQNVQNLNYYFLFIARLYLLLNSDSKFLQEFTFVWDETFS